MIIFVSTFNCLHLHTIIKKQNNKFPTILKFNYLDIFVVSRWYIFPKTADNYQSTVNVINMIHI